MRTIPLEVPELHAARTSAIPKGYPIGNAYSHLRTKPGLDFQGARMTASTGASGVRIAPSHPEDPNLSIQIAGSGTPPAQGSSLTPRSLLFAPADSERKVSKALSSSADIVILDLEDAVAPPGKDKAREIACAALASPRARPIAVRINAADTPWYLKDVAAIGVLAPEVIVLPKSSGSTDVLRLADQLSVLESLSGMPVGKTGILPLVTENAASLANLDYRTARSRLMALGFAGEDLAADLGIKGRDATGMNPLLTHARLAVALAAATAGVPAIDTPFPDPSDPDGLKDETYEAARLGFSGKMCIHPGQIDAVHSAFCPSQTSLDWAQAVVAAFAATPGEGVTVLDGKMIDVAHLRLARRWLQQSVS